MNSYQYKFGLKSFKIILKDLFINNVQSDLVKSISNSEKFLIPVLDDNIRLKLLGDKETQNVTQYINDTNNYDLKKFIRKYKQSISNPNFNPKKKYVALDYWVEQPDIFQKLNDKIFKNFQNKFEVNVLHIGNKGSGKTILQNVWLKKNDELLEENNIFWVRCDAHKLYRIWQDQIENEYINKEQLVSINEYFDIQFLYVFAKYYNSEKHPFFYKIYNEIKLKNLEFDCVVGKSHDQTVKENCIKFIDKFNKDINTWEMLNKHKKPSYAVDIVMKLSQSSKNSRQKNKYKWLYLSRVIQDYILENGYKLLRILDGIDNLEAKEESLTYYKKAIIQTRDIIETHPRKNTINFFAMRERTYIDILNGGFIQRDTPEFQTTPEIIYHKYPILSSIFKERLKYINDNLQEIQLPYISEFFENHIFQIKNDQFAVGLNYHQNIRVFLHNNLSLFQHIYYRFLQSGKNNINFKFYYNTYSNRIKLLNNNFFLETYKFYDLSDKMGSYCHNIFYFKNYTNKFITIDNWYGLSNTRLLQLLSSKNHFNETDIYNFLNTTFDYPLKLIEDILKINRNYGLVDSKLINNAICYETSLKGKSILKLIYSDLDILYTLSLDTWIPELFLKHNLIKAYNNNLPANDYPFPTEYGSSCVISSVNFMYLLVYKEKLELENYKEDNIFKIPKNQFLLPLHNKSNKKKYLTRIRNLINGVNNSELDILNEYFNYLNTTANKVYKSLVNKRLNQS